MELMIAVAGAVGVIGGRALEAWQRRSKTSAEAELLRAQAAAELLAAQTNAELKRAQIEQERTETLNIVLGQVGELAKQLSSVRDDLAVSRMETATCDRNYNVLMEKYTTVVARLDAIDARSEALVVIETAKEAAEDVVKLAIDKDKGGT